MGAAGFANVQVDDAVAETVEGAVVGGPAVLDAGVAEAHVVEKLVFEVLQEHDGARLVHEVHVFVAVDVVAGGQGDEHVEVVGLFAHLADVFVEVFRAHLLSSLISHHSSLITHHKREKDNNYFP